MNFRKWKFKRKLIERRSTHKFVKIEYVPSDSNFLHSLSKFFEMKNAEIYTFFNLLQFSRYVGKIEGNALF